ncbi:MAG: PQQ-binding-like beta-propeller repeat protein, partial [Planctomycetota bacterium]
PVAVSTQAGEVVWRNNELKIDHATGPGSSPVLWNNLLIFSHDGMDRQSLVALDKSTGKVAWRKDRSGEMHSNPQLKKAYGTPLMLTLDGKPTILSNAANWLYAYEPSTGEELWKVEYGKLGFSNVPLLLVNGDMVYVCTGFMKSELQAYQLQGRDNPPELVWQFRKQVPAVSSPLLVEDRIYFVADRGGVLTCVDAKSGEQVWQDRISGDHAASPTYAAGHIFVPNREGATVVIKAGDTFEKVAVNKLDSPILATPAIVDGAIYLRTEKSLYRIEDKPAT